MRFFGVWRGRLERGHCSARVPEVAQRPTDGNAQVHGNEPQHRVFVAAQPHELALPCGGPTPAIASAATVAAATTAPRTLGLRPVSNVAVLVGAR